MSTAKKNWAVCIFRDFEAIQVPEHLIDYIDYEAYGRDIRIIDGGHFSSRRLCGG